MLQEIRHYTDPIESSRKRLREAFGETVVITDGLNSRMDVQLPPKIAEVDRRFMAMIAFLENGIRAKYQQPHDATKLDPSAAPRGLVSV